MRTFHRTVTIGLVVLAFSPRHAPAAEPARPSVSEGRDYEILVSGKPTGKSSTVIAELADGGVLVSTSADVRVNFVVYEYVYQFDGKERWHGNQLASFACQAVDGGTKCATRGKRVGQGTEVAVNDAKPVVGPVFAMSTNYWHAPHPEHLDKEVAIIDTDSGKTFRVKFRRVGQERLRLNNQDIVCTHYQISGDRAADLWFDGDNRLVRQTCVEDGYPTEVRLTMKRQLPAPDRR